MNLTIVSTELFADILEHSEILKVEDKSASTTEYTIIYEGFKTLLIDTAYEKYLVE
ncbi:hypothetical protein GHJ48_05940 [Acinetobacter sp. dk771]|uniref:Uncharacterized protein n=1 Tax=Acinetobacter wanghuae TaxID=2662362 RepID=A0AA90W4C3_9GAMM|nr:hypothetical protein [Acinetobacter wanghuae]